MDQTHPRKPLIVFHKTKASGFETFTCKQSSCKRLIMITSGIISARSTLLERSWVKVCTRKFFNASKLMTSYRSSRMLSKSVERRMRRREWLISESLKSLIRYLTKIS